MKKIVQWTFAILILLVTVPIAAPFWLVIWFGNLIFAVGLGLMQVGDFITYRTHEALKLCGKPIMVLYRKVERLGSEEK